MERIVEHIIGHIIGLYKTSDPKKESVKSMDEYMEEISSYGLKREIELINAVKSQNLEEVKLLIKQGADVNFSLKDCPKRVQEIMGDNKRSIRALRVLQRRICVRSFGHNLHFKSVRILMGAI